MIIKSFRGKIADLGTDVISLHTNTGSTGYRITKFQIMSPSPGVDLQESVVKIYKIPFINPQDSSSTPDGLVDFSDNTLLGVAYLETHGEPWYTDSDQVIFDQEIFNQDIYVTHKDVATGVGINYYIELEQVKLALDENTVATLKDIRNITQPE